MSDTLTAVPTDATTASERRDEGATPADESSRIPHVPALDGIRALAVLAVMVYHHFATQTVNGLPGGFLGVDVFFVLSGFLITTLLLIDHERTGRVVSWRFWERRLRRLLPAMLVMLCFIAVYAHTLAPTFRLESIRKSAFATLLYAQNYWQLYGSSQGRVPLAHTWSLSVEEQFYFVWPLALAGVMWACRRRPRMLAWLVGVLVVASAWRMRAIFEPLDPWRAYLTLDARAHEMLVGALLAVVLRAAHTRQPPRWVARLLEAAAWAVLAWLTWLAFEASFFDAWLYRGGFLAISLASAVLIAAVMLPTSRILRAVLGWRPLAAIGLISYGLYLFHIPVYYVVAPEHVHLDGITLGVARFATTFALAIASYWIIERPVRMRAAWLPPMRWLAPGAVVVTVAALLYGTSGATEPPKSLSISIAYYNQGRSAEPGSTRVLVAGDTFAMTLGMIGRAPYKDNGIHGVTVAVPTCGLARGMIVEGATRVPESECRTQPVDFELAARGFAPHVVVLSFGVAEVFGHEVDGRMFAFGTPEYERYLKSRLARVQEIVTTGGANVVLLTTPCMQPAPGGPFTALHAGQADPERIAWLNGVWRRYAAEHPDVVLADLDRVVCRNGVRRVDPTAGPLGAPDGITLSAAGAKVVWDWIAPIAEAARADRVDPAFAGG